MNIDPLKDFPLYGLYIILANLTVLVHIQLYIPVVHCWRPPLAPVVTVGSAVLSPTPAYRSEACVLWRPSPV